MVDVKVEDNVYRRNYKKSDNINYLDGDIESQMGIDWNKFLVLVTLEPSTEVTNRWFGPVVMRGMSRSGMMHTLAGHGPYEHEPCLKYGFK